MKRFKICLLSLMTVILSATVFSVAAGNTSIFSSEHDSQQVMVPIAISPEDSLKVQQTRRVILDDEPPVVGNDTVAVKNDMSGIQLYDSGLAVDERGADSLIKTPMIIRVALVLSDIYGKKEMEFVKGFMLGLSNIDMPSKSISLKVINGEMPTDSLMTTLSDFEPHAIFITQDTDCPIDLLDYAGEHSTRIINVFEAKGEEYNSYPSIIQILTPSQTFNASAAKYMTDTFSGANLILVGNPDPNDMLIKEISGTWPSAKKITMTPDEVETFRFNNDKRYVIYPCSSNPKEVKTVLDKVKLVMEENPDANITIFGRPNWIVINNLGALASGLDLFFPSKFYFDASSNEGKKFISDFMSKYGLTPIKSHPVFSVMGYDMAHYFLPQLYRGQIDSDTSEWETQETLQLLMSLKSDNWYSGDYNRGSFIIHYSPDGKINKIPLLP